MLKSVNTASMHTCLNDHVREGYEAGIKESAPGNCTCFNCGEQFSNRRKLRYHYTKCPYYVNVQRTNEINAAPKELKCLRCGKKFVGNTQKAFHQKRCGYYVAMHQADSGVIDTVKTDIEKERDTTEINDDVIIIDNEDETDNEEDTVVQTEDLNFKKNEKNEGFEITDFTVQDIKVENEVASDNPSTVNQLEDTRNADPFQISKHVRETVKIKTELMMEQKTYYQKRKYDVMLLSYDKSQITPKKIKSQEGEEPLHKLLIDDMHQEHRQNVFDRVSTDQRAYRCPTCSVRFKYKHKYDIHVKFAHIQSGSLVTATDLKATKSVPENDFSATRFTESKESTDKNTVLNCFNEGNMKSSSSPYDNYTVKPRVGNYPCDFCHMSFRYFSRCERHIKSVHKEQGDQLKFGNIFRCTECQERFSDKYALLKHYNRHHMRNAPTGAMKAIYEQFNNILNVNDVMKHLRKNLTCLQDGKGAETDQSDNEPRLKTPEPRLKMVDYFQDSNQSTESMFNKSEGELEPRERDFSTSDISENTTDTGTPKRETAARTETSNICHFDHKLTDNTFTGDYVEKKELLGKDGSQKDKIRNYFDSSEYDKPLDLSTKTESRTEHDTREKMIAVDKKPSDSERVLLMEYYTDFLHEYGLN